MGNPNRDKKHSKLLALVLRHDPGKIGVELDEAGWTDVGVLLRKIQGEKRGRGLDRATLERIVADNDKKRFQFSEDGSRIRAVQGHSVSVDLGDPVLEPPDCLYHGTVRKFEKAIRSAGLLKMSRHAVHLSFDWETAEKVGSRRGKPVLLKVRSGQMHQDGFEFRRSANGVWYTDHVPKEYVLWPGDSRYNRIGVMVLRTPDFRDQDGCP